MKHKLSLEQQSIITDLSKHLVVIAGAGTGKTTVLTEKIKYLINNNIKPNKILAITFTKKAANEMKLRINNEEVLVYTFDAYCYSLLKNQIDIEIIKDNIPFYKKEVLSFHLYDANLKVHKKPSKYNDYINYKLKNQVYDFNDLEYLALNQLNNQAFDYILVDEFQDTNMLQFEVLKALIKPNTKTMVVGDPDQSIYKFRGAYPNIFNDYIKHYNANILTLTNNYRSNKKIIQSANNLVAKNKDRIKKTLIAYNENLGVIALNIFNEDILEARFIINKYETLKKQGYKSFAILYRNHSMAYTIKLMLLNLNHNISLLTIHEAKGLEFDVVFLIGLNKNLFPSTNIINNLMLEEERRLMFVAVTRAKYELYLTSSSKKISRFVNELTK